MHDSTRGTIIDTYDQYCTIIDEALRQYAAPLTNAYMLTSEAQQMIDHRLLYYLCNEHALSVFCIRPGMYQCIYVADGTADTSIPLLSGDRPMVIDHICAPLQPVDPMRSALFERSGFTLARSNIRLVRTLDASCVRAEARDRAPVIAYAQAAERDAIYALLEKSFDPCTDQLPSHSELDGLIAARHVFVIRDAGRVIAASIRVPNGMTVNNHWIVLDAAYRGRGFSTILHQYEDEDSYTRGYKRVTLWIDAQSSGWIKKIEQAGYRRDGYMLYTYINRQQP